MSSSRLPGKVLLDIVGQPMLARVVRRARRARSISQAIVATTDDPADDAIVDFCKRRGFPFFRGSQFDVLDRYYQAARLYQAQTVVRLTADCPLIDPGEIDHVVAEFQKASVDFAANRLPPPWKRTYPIGLDIEVCSFSALERAWREAHEPFEREHVMPYFYDEPGRFKTLVLDHEPDYGSIRWTVDTPEDLQVVRWLYELFEGRDDFTWLEALDIYFNNPNLKEINQTIVAKKVDSIDDRSGSTNDDDQH
jgi:spore coat polysaccharide biosynthesis protein SpsF